jgi:uncharacterized membrane protein
MNRSVNLMTSEQVKSLKRLKKVIIVVALICLCCVIVAFIFKIIKIKEAPVGDPKTDAKYLCHSFAGVSVNMTWIVITASMSLMTGKIKRIN